MKILDALNKKEKPKATIIVNSYNHSDYIAACLKSIIHQEVTFSCELIIYDDYSSDSTKDGPVILWTRSSICTCTGW